MKITKRQLKRIINEYHPRPDDDYDPLNPDDDEDDVAYDQGYDDGFNGYPSNPVVGGDYHVGYEEGVNAAKDEDSRAEDAEEFGPHSPGMMGPPRREGKVRLTKRQLRRIIKEELLKEAGGELERDRISDRGMAERTARMRLEKYPDAIEVHVILLPIPYKASGWSPSRLDQEYGLYIVEQPGDSYPGEGEVVSVVTPDSEPW